MHNNDKKGAAVKFPPPLIFIFLIFIAYAIHTIIPIGIGITSPFTYLGIVIIILALVLLVFISQTFTRVKTHIEPWKPTSAIIATGIYAYSRNPIYMAFCLVPIGVGIITNSLWILFSFLPSVLLVYFMAIKKEEAYLEEKFGEEYLQYKNSVRRWI